MNFNKKCRNITGPPTIPKATQARMIGKEMAPTTMLSWINLTKPHALERKLILARLDLARKNNYLIPKVCQKLPILLYYFLNNWTQFQKELSTIS